MMSASPCKYVCFCLSFRNWATERDLAGGSEAASHRRTQLCCRHVCLENLRFTALKSVCVHWTKLRTHQDPGKLLPFHPLGPCRQRSPASACLSLSLSRALSLGRDSAALCYQSLKFSEVAFARVSRSPSRLFCVLCKCSWSGVAALC